MRTPLRKTLEIRTSPHILSGYSVDTIMFNVLALLPVTAFSVYAFGLPGALTLTVAVISCVLTEHLVCTLNGRPTTTEATYAPAEESVLSDTLRASGSTGETLILALPDAMDGQEVTGYRILRAPSLSGLVDRSYFWRPQTHPAGEYTIVFEATFEEPPVDTLIVLATLE